MICYLCNGGVYASALSSGECKICGKAVFCPHMPCYKLCEECSDKEGFCQQCERPQDRYKDQ